MVPATEEEIRNFKQQMNIDDGGSSENDAEDETEGKQPSEEDDAGGGAWHAIFQCDCSWAL